jgi:hypothetical protein
MTYHSFLLSLCLISMALFSSCQSFNQKSSSEKEGQQSQQLSLNQTQSLTQIDSKIKVSHLKENKSYTAKGQWFLDSSGSLRLDILGPFDLLMAQGFYYQGRTKLIDHRNKTILSHSQSSTLTLDGYPLPLQDLGPLLKQQTPQGWTCSLQEKQKPSCQKQDQTFSSQWVQGNTLQILYQPFTLDITVLNQSEPSLPPTVVFDFVEPKSYKVTTEKEFF